MNQNGAMHRFDAFSGDRFVKTTAKKYNTQFANASSIRKQTLQFFRQKKYLNKSGFSQVIFIAFYNVGLGI
jgi:peptidyl-tRNA hydrolase